MRRFVIEPEEAGLSRARAETLQGGEAEHNAIELKRLLQGQHGTYRDIVSLNAAAALVVAGKVPKLSDGVQLAAMAIDDGSARETLEALIDITQRQAR
jgi:anthranilate phosphoribosyltransferase